MIFVKHLFIDFNDSITEPKVIRGDRNLLLFFTGFEIQFLWILGHPGNSGN